MQIAPVGDSGHHEGDGPPSRDGRQKLEATVKQNEGAESGLEDIGSPLRELRARFSSEVEPHRRALWSYCLRLTGSAWDAEDLVQEVMRRALAGLADFWQPVNPRAYLFRTATNTWIDSHRRSVREEIREIQDDERIAPPDQDLAIETREAMTQLVANLTPLQRVVLLLIETLDHTAREAASLLHTTEGAVKAALHRARASLKRANSGPRPHASLRDTRVADPMVQRFIEAFNRRDADAIAALLHENAEAEIVGTAVEIGRDIIRQNSLAEWAAEVPRQWARAGTFEGRDVLFVLSEGSGGQPALYSLLECEWIGDQIARQRVYFYCPELLGHVAAALGLDAITHGHSYTPS